MAMSLWILCVFLPGHAASGVWQSSNQSDAMALKAATSIFPVFGGNRSLKEHYLPDRRLAPQTPEAGFPPEVIVGLVLVLLFCPCWLWFFLGRNHHTPSEPVPIPPPERSTTRTPDPGHEPPSEWITTWIRRSEITDRAVREKQKPPSVQFAWGEMSAQWPRGKVAYVRVEAGSFEAFGHQYSIEHADEPGIGQFHWGDGTLQISDSIDRNTIWWRTNHPNRDWQRFLWVCTPPCTCGPASHAMEFSESSYKCSVCRSQGHGKHWQCVQHDVHFCYKCAVPPLTPPTLGVSARYIVEIFPSLARSATGLENPNFYEICPRLALGEHGLGFGMLGYP
eukprot:s259_g18.t1